MTRSAATIRNVEPEVKSRESVCVKDNELDGKVEAVEGCLVVEPSLTGERPASVANAGSVGRANAE